VVTFAWLLSGCNSKLLFFFTEPDLVFLLCIQDIEGSKAEIPDIVKVTAQKCLTAPNSAMLPGNTTTAKPSAKIL